MTVIGIGLDLVEIDRFKRLYGSFDPAVLDRCFTQHEQSITGSDDERLRSLAVRFATKEAVLKTIGGLRDGISLTDIEIVSGGALAPTVKLGGGALAAADQFGIVEWKISLTHEAKIVAAVALAIGA